MKPLKQELRRYLNDKVKEIPFALKGKKEAELSFNLAWLLKKLYLLINKKTGVVIGGYSPMNDEVNWMHVLKKIDFKHDLSFPTSSNSGMDFLKALPSELVESRIFGAKILIPQQGSLKVFPDIFFVPGRGFDLDGKRLGRGKGFYDRFLAQNEGIKIGVCFDCQLDGHIPVTDCDIAMDYVVTETLVANCKTGMRLIV